MQIAAFSMAVSAVPAFGQVADRGAFPQPQFIRTQWKSLSGQWDFAFDDGNRGLGQHWERTWSPAARKIEVPFCFESKAGGIADTNIHPVIWYRRNFVLSPTWSGKNVLLHFGAVNYRTWVWLNGQFFGTHVGGNVPFSFEIGRNLRPGENVLTLRVETPASDKGVPRGKQYWEPKPKSIFYTRTSGIWQAVWLEATGENYLDHVQVVAGRDGIAHFKAMLGHRLPEALTFEIAIHAGGETVTRQANTELGLATVDVPITDAQLWSPESPHLYDVTYRLLRGTEVLDEVHSYLGFRTIGIADDRVTINGKPVYLKFVLDQGYWPQSILTPPSMEAIKRDIELTQAMGFNGVRVHQKVADPRFLYWADVKGLLVSGEMADALLFDDDVVTRFTKEWIAAVEREYNHPSIIIWNAINESWGVPDLSDVRQQAYLKELYQLTHTLDSTRLAIDNEGWMHTNDTDLFALHDYEKSGEALYEKYKNVSPESKTVPPNGRPALIAGYSYNGSPLYLSEFGGIAYIPPGANVPAESWGYSGVEKSQDAAMARLTQLYEGIAKLHNLAGICYTQLDDVEQEVNGLTTYDRKPKFDLQKIKALNDMLH
ncbi:MAG TPA: glycoside hydrolase family 2 TIM barrel-domain containing protein [Bryobacteraceae bacterium]|nr:glycoside hydrolase family 2 TIM barrel-domain containing protein [Bryobacteraceae bacterium]